MSVIRRLRPGKLNLVMAQEAASPKTMFAGTAIDAIVSVSRIAERQSGSVRVSDMLGQSWLPARTSTSTTGRIRKETMNKVAMAIRP